MMLTSSAMRAMRVPGNTEPTIHAGVFSCSNISTQKLAAFSFGKITNRPPTEYHWYVNISLLSV